MAKGIYCYIDKKDNQIVYVGKDSNIHRNIRHKTHHQLSSYHTQVINRVLQNNINRYQYKILWTIDDCTTNHLNQMEIYFINKYNPKFNFTSGGDGGRLSVESRKKISQALKGKYCGKKNAFFGQKHNETTKSKIRQAKLGAKNPNYNKRMSIETRKKMSESHNNTTGFYRVYKFESSTYKKGFGWRYQYVDNSNRRFNVSATSLSTLKQKVLDKNLEWLVLNEEKAKQSLLLDDV